jgi:hypothetical protein
MVNLECVFWECTPSWTLLNFSSQYQLWLVILFYFLCFHMVFNDSSLFMSMSNLILIIIHLMDMKKHLLIIFYNKNIGKKNDVIIK